MRDIEIQEKLASLRNEMSHLWGGAFIVGGGSVALLLNELDLSKCIVAIVGIALMVVFFNAYILKHNEVKKLVKQLKEET